MARVSRIHGWLTTPRYDGLASVPKGLPISARNASIPGYSCQRTGGRALSSAARERGDLQPAAVKNMSMPMLCPRNHARVVRSSPVGELPYDSWMGMTVRRRKRVYLDTMVIGHLAH